jgi:uncharacterized membrane protein
MTENPIAIAAVLLGVISLSLWLTDRFSWAKRVSAVLWILFLSALASNLGVIPKSAALYSGITSLTVPFAVCLILFTVNLSDVRKAGKAMIVAFVVASIGTVAGVLAAGLALDPLLQGILGEESWKLAGPYTGTYIGGSLNFFALWEGLEIGDPDLFAAANAVDNLTIFPLFAVWILVPTWLGSRFVVGKFWTRKEDTIEQEPPEEVVPRFVPTHVAILSFSAFLIMWLSDWITTDLLGGLPFELPSILVLTTLALIVAQLGLLKNLEGAWRLGNLAFYLFFAAVGALIDIYSAVVLSPALFAYVMIILVVHMVVLYGLGRLLKLDVGVLTIASVATKAGPALVPAIADSKGWKELALPGVIVALLGYAVGNYAGFATAYVMKFFVSG